MVSHISALVDKVKISLSPEAQVLDDPAASDFQDRLARWSDINRQTPAAIVLPATENDVATVVKLATNNGVPFTSKSGGHSLWSTIGKEGFILDLSLLKKISVDREAGTVSLQSGILIKEANDAAYAAGLCLTLGNANSAGVIPMAVGGGLSVLHAKHGFASDNILSARIITAKGDIIEVSASQEPDLLWALRGAGQHFGVVTEITLQAYPLSTLGTDDGTVWTGTIIFPIERADEFIKAMEPLLSDASTPHLGLLLISAPPPSFATCIILIPIYLGSAAEAEKYYSSLLSLKPLLADVKSVVWNRVNDSMEVFCSKGQFKRFAGAGAHKFKPGTFPKLIERFEELKAKCPDAGATCYAIEYSMHVPQVEPAGKDTAFGHKDIKVWMELLSWYTEAGSHDEVFRIEQEALEDFRKANPEVDPAIYQNWSRDVPVEYRYRGPGRLEKLKALKKIWDPTGVFTREFL